MHYRVAYNVLQEGYDPLLSPRLLFLFLSAVFATALGGWTVLRLRREPDRSKRGGRGNWGLALLVPPVLVLVFGWVLCRPVVEQWRARAWAGAADYEVTEGTVTGLGHSHKGGTHFRVAGVPFRYYPPADPEAEGGVFRGRFTDPGVPADALRNDLPVRIAHHGGVILRLEIAGPEGRDE
jgi:hypothetical protein